MSKCRGDPVLMKRTRILGRVQQMLATKADRHGLALRDALLVKQAEHWLQLGEPVQALNQLQSLPASAEMNTWVLKVHVAAIHAAMEQGILG